MNRRRARDRGSALLELCVVTPALVAVVAVTLGAGYLILARAWLDHQSEQALYCLAEGKDRRACVRAFTRRVHERLMFGRVTAFTARRARGRWAVEVTWRVSGLGLGAGGPFRLRLAKTLTLARVRRTGVR